MLLPDEPEYYGILNGSSVTSTPNPINTNFVLNPPPQQALQTVRFGTDFTYTIPNLIPGAAYDVRLDFAEISHNSAGQRVFNVLINGSTVLNGFDIYATANRMDTATGEYVAIAEDFPTAANSAGQIVIEFKAIVDNAMVNAIQVTPLPETFGIDSGVGLAGEHVADADFTYPGSSFTYSTHKLDRRHRFGSCGWGPWVDSKRDRPWPRQRSFADGLPGDQEVTLPTNVRSPRGLVTHSIPVRYHPDDHPVDRHECLSESWRRLIERFGRLSLRHSLDSRTESFAVGPRVGDG